MKKIFPVFLTTVISLCMISVAIAASNSVYEPSGGCKIKYIEWQAKKGGGAFAVSRNGKACGWGFGDYVSSTHKRQAIRNCAKYGKQCRIMQVKKSATITTPWIPKGRCKKRYQDWSYKLGRAAFAVTKSGLACGWSSIKPSLKAAKEQALFICRRHYARCKIIKTR